MRARKRRAMRRPRRPPRAGRPAGFGAGQAAAAIARSAATFYFKGHESHGTYPLIFGDMGAGEVARRARRAPARGHGAGDRATRPEDRHARAGTVYFVASRRHAGTGPGPGPVRGSCKDATRADRQARSMAGFIRKAVFRGARNLGVKQGITAITWNESASFITYLDRFGKGYFLIAIAMASCADKPVTATRGPLTAAARDRVEPGRTASVGEVVRAGLRALDREEALLDERFKARVAEVLADPRPVQPAEAVRSGLAARHAKRTRQGA